ncbi:hypothetical protein DU002_06060 [Corallincola holothuriorum]|uniref:Helix-turn-helix domain-containing protein n=1 Tax=Corallincola holothuriorum TaxID=2282215 RepID=A0A368NKB1_9GAMM|nr:winged helix-turn-helix domain-containing protein [Corallincola holothuriorum]RCU50888.1 hypothetical protein DU002_06060 [Corallincola holothuriorum]
MTQAYSKTQTSFYRRLYLAHLIDAGVNTVPAIIEATDMPRRTAQDTLNALSELGVEIEFVGANKNGHYKVVSWGPINPQWVKSHHSEVKKVLGYL